MYHIMLSYRHNHTDKNEKSEWTKDVKLIIVLLKLLPSLMQTI